MEQSREQILQEIARIKYLYKMKGVFRYDRSRDPWARAESNAEHLYGMMILLNYFLPLEDPERDLDAQRIYELILVHDLDEIEAGDVVSYKKTDADRAIAKEGLERSLQSVPQHMAYSHRERIAEYEAQETREAQLVKALDKLEPLVELFDKYGKKIQHDNQTTREQARAGREQYISKFPAIHQYFNVLFDEMEQQGYFYE